MKLVTFYVGGGMDAAPSQQIVRFGDFRITTSLRGSPTIQVAAPTTEGPEIPTMRSQGTDLFAFRPPIIGEPPPAKTDPWLRCRILQIGQGWGADSKWAGADIEAVGYKQIIGERFLLADMAPISTEQGEIVWAFVAYTQARTGGNFGVTKGNVTTGITRQRSEYANGDNIGDLIDALEKVQNGPVVQIDGKKVLTVRMPNSFPTKSQPIKMGDNAIAMRRVPSGLKRNVSGAVGSDEHTTPEWVTQPGTGTDPIGRWETFDSSHGSVTEQSTVLEYAQGNLAELRRPPYVWQARIKQARWLDGSARYDPGDFVWVVEPSDTIDPSGTGGKVLVQIEEVAIGTNRDGKIDITVAGAEVLSSG